MALLPFPMRWTAFAATLLFALGAGAASETNNKSALKTAEAKPSALASSHHLSMVTALNPHLHGGLAGAAPHLATPPAIHPTTPAGHPTGPGKPELVERVTVHVHNPRLPIIQVVHATWAPRWDAHAFIALHRGLATIQGILHDAGGRPVSNVRVALQHPRGRPFAAIALRHVTYTSANGSFLMTNVRPGTYRVFASLNKRKARLRSIVHANERESLSMKI